MIAVTLRGLLSRKLRTVLTAIAIILGVSMISGTYVLTDTINESFSAIFHQADRKLDAVISGKVQSGSQEQRLPPALPARLLGVVKGTDGVDLAVGEIADRAQLFDMQGNAVSANNGPPSILVSVPPARVRTSRLVRGHWPHGRQVVVDNFTFTRHNLHLGERLRVAGSGPAEVVTLVGSIKFGNVNSLGGASIVEVDLATAQHIAQKEGKYDQISVIASSGVTQAEVVRRIKASIPATLRSTVQVKTAEQNATDQSAAIAQGLSFLTIGLLAFGGIAVFVGAFIIFNTFSITIAQRTREFALLRTLGALRRQILLTVAFEALVIGIASSIVGLGAGFLISKALGGLFTLIGADLPNQGMVIKPRTIVVALLTGTLVTIAAGAWPAVRATRVPPIAALREGAALPHGRFARYMPILAGLLALAGVALIAVGIFASISSSGERLSLIGLGAALLFLGVAMLSPQLVRPLASVVGWPVERLTSITGRLARENAVRNPSRTAVTAAALMIGLALVGFVTIFAAELRASANDAISRELAGDFAVYNDSGAQIPQGAAAALRHVPGVSDVSALKTDTATIKGIGSVNMGGLQPAAFAKVYHFQWVDGSAATLTAMGPHDALVDEQVAKDNHLKVGSHLVTTTSIKRHLTLTVTGIYKHSQLLTGIDVRYDTMQRAWGLNQDELVLINAAPGQSLQVVKARISRLLKAEYPTASPHSQQDIKDRNAQQVNQILVLIYVLLAMSVLVSLFGIINTLVLSVYERTREIGMLRAIGTTRAQVRWMVRWESVITAVIGAVLGLLLGIVLAVLVTAGLQDQGIEYTIPVGQLLLWVVFAMLFGIVAAAFPARRAARMDVLQAIAYE